MENESNRPSSDAADNLEKTLEHAKAGYANAQDVIKFIDTKTGVMTGLLTLLTGLPILAVQWASTLEEKASFRLESFSVTHPISFEILADGLVLGMVFGVGGILFSVHGLMARDPRLRYQGLGGFFRKISHKLFRKYKVTNDIPKETVLFPIFPPHREEQAKKHFRKMLDGFSPKEILGEYEHQFAQVGRILNIKILSNKRAVFCFQMQVLAYVGSMIAAYVAFRLAC